MDGYLSKPARPAEILATLNQLVPDNEANALACPANQMNLVTVKEFSADMPVFDRAALLERLGGQEEMLGIFFDMFINNVAGYIELLLSAFEQRDGEQVRIQAHAIKGAAGNISALRVCKAATEVEQHVREGRLGEATELVLQLKKEIEAFQHEVSLQTADYTKGDK